MNRTQQKAANARLAELEIKGGGNLTHEMVLADAQDPSSPLHDYFEWDDTKAAQAWRIEQARLLVRSVRVVINTERQVITTIGYVRNPDLPGDEPGYVSTARILNDKDRAREVLLLEFERVTAALRRARELAIAFGLEDDVDLLQLGVTMVRGKINPDDRPAMQ